MWTTILATLESKKFVTAFLTVIAMVAAWKGLDIPVDRLLMLATPIMVAIGAQGWADSGKEAAKINAAAAWKPVDTTEPHAPPAATSAISLLDPPKP